MTTGTGVGKRASATGSGSGYAVYKPLPSPIPAESGPDDVVDDSQRGDNDEDTRSDSTATPTPTPSARTPTPTAGPTDEHASATATPVHRKHTAGSLNTNIVGDVQKKVAFLSPTSPSPSPAPLESIHENSNNLNPSQQSLRSGTPYSQMSGVGSRILSATSWSEVTEEDLVLNLGSRERTRQEVLFEIISSEERYVGELAKMKEMFIEPLLHPYYPRRVLSPEPLSVTETPEQMPPKPSSPLSSRSDSLPPIAARFMSPTPQNEMLEEGDDSGDDLMDDDEEDEAARKERQKKNVHPRSPYRASASQKKTIIPFPSASGARSHQSLPPPPHGNQQSRSGNNPNAVSTQSLGRQSIGVERERERERSQSQSQGRSSSAAKGMFKKLRTSTNNNNSNQDPFDTNNPNALPLPIIPPHLLPPDLRICLEVIDSGVFEGHKRLAEALRKRYDDQYPLVRSLADVFVANSDIFQGYATYVLHLERALDQVDNAINDMSPPHPPSSKSTSLHQKSLIPTLLRTLDTLSSYSGQTSLSISLSKPFQRLLKYPLLFQNLLYNTDPSTTEYESTLQLVAEIEVMVRGIEDEKVEWEDRERTRDALGRIEWGDGNGDSGGGPKPGRVLIEETVYTPPADELPSTNGNGGATSPPPPPPSAFNTPIQTKKSKSSFRRLSDALSPSPPSSKTGIGIGGSTGKQVKPFGKKDLWLVVFNDVVLLCQRTGVTTVPIWSSGGENLTKGGGDKEKDKAGMGKRQIRAKPRNLYKFLKVETWVMEDIVREGVVTMAECHATPAHSPQQLSNQPRIIPMPADDERPGLTSSAHDSDADSSDSDRKSKMSFSYWGADKVTVQRPVGLSSPSGAGTGGRSAHGHAVLTPSAYSRESSANAKFGTRLVSDREKEREREREKEKEKSERSEKERAASRRTVGTTGSSTPVPGPISVAPSRSRESTSTSTSASASAAGKASGVLGTSTPVSPAPSEDSGVGLNLYRQIQVQGLVKD
ncbi:Dbl domain-containing protein [Lentinula raphanica]|nr:Dbl domain-containing protein [Lentinula raphanica]